MWTNVRCKIYKSLAVPLRTLLVPYYMQYCCAKKMQNKDEINSH